MGKFLKVLLLIVPGVLSEVPKNYFGLTLGGQLLFYDVQIEHQFNKKYSAIAAFSYFENYRENTLIGMQADFAPFKNLFNLSAGVAYLTTDKNYSVFIPDLGMDFKMRGENWMFKIRPAVLYQTSKEFFFPWIGFTLLRNVGI